MKKTPHDFERAFNFPPIQLDQLNWFPKENMRDDMPIFDAEKLNTEEELITFVKEVREKKIFYIENHGIEEALIQKLININRAFFSLPESEKLKFTPPEMEVDKGGYKGFKKSSVAKVTGIGNNVDQLMNYVFYSHGNEVLYPDKIFKEVSEAYSKKVTNLSRLFIEKLLYGLSLFDPDFTYTEKIKDSFINGGLSRDMMILYPAVEQDEDAKERMASHFDTSLITILYQIPALGDFSEKPYIGFELDKEGVRIPAPAVRGTFVVNFGELIHHLTNGSIPATYHGVKRPTIEELSKSERMTIVSFYFPNPKAKIKLSSIKGSISYNAIQNGDLKEGQEVTLKELRKAMFKKFYT